MLKLIATPTSPYARKVRVALAEKKIEYQWENVSPWEEPDLIARHSPLGKVPVLVFDDGSSLFDSRVIVEYLDSVSPVSRLIPEPARQRIAVRRWEALADGMCDAASAIVLEKKRSPAQRDSGWTAWQQQKIAATVAEMARELDRRLWCNGENHTLADIATGCALAYLDLRYAEFDWRDRYGNLAQWFEKMNRRPAFAGTAAPV